MLSQNAISGAAIGGNPYGLSSPPVDTTPTVTSVTVTPATATLAGGATFDFDWIINGTNSPSQAATVSTTLGTINSAGVVTAPAATSSVQTGTVTVTSTLNPSKSGTATFTVAAAATTNPGTGLTTRMVSINLVVGVDANNQPIMGANLQNIKYGFYDEATPDLYTTARKQSSTGTTDANGLFTFTVQSSLAYGGSGGLAVQLPDGTNFNITVPVS